MKILVLGYGNRGRNDDGAAWFVVEHLQAEALPGVECQAFHQLEIDLAETLTRFDHVIFVDAAVTSGVPVLSRHVVEPRFESHAVAHFLTPSDLLAMAGTLYGHSPGAMLFTIPGRDFHFGSTLSPQTAHAAQQAVGEISSLIALLQERNAPTHSREPNHA